MDNHCDCEGSDDCNFHNWRIRATATSSADKNVQRNYRWLSRSPCSYHVICSEHVICLNVDVRYANKVLEQKDFIQKDDIVRQEMVYTKGINNAWALQ